MMTAAQHSSNNRQQHQGRTEKELTRLTSQYHRQIARLKKNASMISSSAKLTKPGIGSDRIKKGSGIGQPTARINTRRSTTN